ncbi:hypothetical protein ACWF94_28670, partial [Streptomyces sp. NPDC055078]
TKIRQDAKKNKKKPPAAKKPARKCENPRQCDGPDAKIRQDAKKNKKKAGGNQWKDAADAATIGGAPITGAKEHDKRAEKWKKEWPASKDAARYRKQGPVTKPWHKALGQRLGGAGAVLTFQANLAQGDSVLKAGVKTGIDAGAVWAGAKTGALIGGAIGSFFPVLGTAAGAFIGGVIGTFVGMKASDAINEQVDRAWK